VGKQIQKISRGTFARSDKTNEIIDVVNALLTMTVREGSEDEAPKLVVSDNRLVLVTTAGGAGGSGPDGEITSQDLQFNGTVGICVNGTPYWMDILYDDTAGLYAVTGDPNHEIPEP
jgi:hypothetical protein